MKRGNPDDTREPDDIDEIDEFDALGELAEALQELMLIGPKEIEQVRDTATAILTAIDQVSARISDSTASNYDGPSPTYYSETLAPLAQALGSVTYLLETYAKLVTDE